MSMVKAVVILPGTALVLVPLLIVWLAHNTSLAANFAPSSVVAWLALTTYLAFYILFFVGLSRVAVHQLRIPLMLAAPIVWTGLELVRAHFVTGFLMAALAHTQYRWISMIQIRKRKSERLMRNVSTEIFGV